MQKKKTRHRTRNKNSTFNEPLVHEYIVIRQHKFYRADGNLKNLLCRRQDTVTRTIK